MKPTNKLLRGHGIRRVVIKPRAHAYTFIAAIWCFLALAGIGPLVQFWHLHGWRIFAAGLVILGIHGVLIGLAIHYWRTERKRKVRKNFPAPEGPLLF